MNTVGMNPKKYSDAFERMTANQIITLVDLHELRFTHEVAKRRNRDLSSVLKQLDTLNATFTSLCGERLLDLETGRGKPVQFTPTGEAVVVLARQFLDGSLETIDKRRREIGKKLTAASTTGMLAKIARLWPKWQERARGAFDLQLEQIRTYDIEGYLNTGRVDLVFSGRIDQGDMGLYRGEFEFLKWSQGNRIVLVSNHTRMPSDPVSMSDIEDGSVPVLLPNRGIIRDLVESILRGNLQNLSVAAIIDDLYFGRGLLRNNIYQAAMFVVEPIANWLIQDQSDMGDIRFHKYEIKGIENYTITDGVFRRRDAVQYGSNHPINLCWEIIKNEVESPRVARRKQDK